MNKLVIDEATGLVENCIVADDTFTLEGKALVRHTGQAEIGDTWDGTQFIKKPVPIEPVEPLTKLQIRQAALSAKWPDAFAMLDDMLKENPAAFPKTRADRDAIKAANPKE